MKNKLFSPPAERKNRRKNKNNKATDKSILFRFNLFISNKITLTVIYFLILFLSFTLTNYVINIIFSFFGNLKNILNRTVGLDLIFNLKNIFVFSLHNKFIYILILIILAIIDAVFVVKIWISYKDFDVGQKGSDRWATIEELRQQYKSIPLKEKEWESKSGGIIISRDGNNYLVDEEPGHNLIVGTTRSGKGEMFVLPTIETLSRCSCKPSIIATDPKLDLTKGCYKMLKNRGYEVIVLNLINKNEGDCFNPLSRIVELYKSGDYEGAYQESRAFAYSIFCSDSDSKREDAEFWGNTATDLLSADIIANIEDCLQLDKAERIEAEYDFNCKKMRGEIPEDAVFTFEPRHEKEINMFSVFNSFRLMAENVDESGRTALDKYFMSRPLMDRARIFYSSINISGYRTKTSIYSNMITKLTAYSYDSLARMTAKSSFEIKDIGFGDKPLAVFLAVPDFSQSEHFFITTFVRQVYYVLSAEAANTADGKCSRPVWNILDEFTNMPALENVEQMVSVGAGRNIFYNFMIQGFTQLDNKYNPHIAKIIRNNCQNQIFIKSNEYDTAEQFSKLLGTETITNIDRIGSRFAVDKTFTERKDEVPLLRATDLMGLLEGECVVKRVMKRKTLKGKDSIPYPIFNTGKNKMPFAHTFLQNIIQYNVKWTDIRKDFPPKQGIESFTFDIVSFYNYYVADSVNYRQQIRALPHYEQLVEMFISDGLDIGTDSLGTRWIVQLAEAIKKSDLPPKRKSEYSEFLKSEIQTIKNNNREIIFK